MRLLTILALLAAASPAYACPMMNSLKPEQLAMADNTFTGKATAYKPQSETGPTTITFNVVKVEKGQQLPQSIEVYWNNSTFGEAESLEEFLKYYGPLTRLSIILPETYKKHTRCEMETYTNGLGEKSSQMECENDLPIPYAAAEAPFNDKPWIIVGSCTTAAMEKAE